MKYIAHVIEQKGSTACKGLIHCVGAFEQEVCVVKTEFTLIRLTREIKYSKPQRGGRKGNGEGGGTLRKNESELKPSDPLPVASETQTMWLGVVGGKQTQ